MPKHPTDATPVIDAFEFARSGGHLAGEVELAQLPRLAESLINADGTLRYQLDGLIDDEEHPGATMHLAASLPMRCQRCNEPMTFELDRGARFRFVRSEEELNALPVEDDEIDDVVGSDAMDVMAWIEDEAILSLPFVPRHSDCALPAASDDDDLRTNPFRALLALKEGGGAKH